MKDEVLEFYPEAIKVKRKPKKCPVCGFELVAVILYGEPVYNPQLCRQLEERSVTLGGCCIVNNAPKWQCTRCGTKFYMETGISLKEEE